MEIQFYSSFPMFSMALIPCPTHDSCDLCSKKIIYVQMWREKVTSLIAKTSCDWYKFNIRGHFPTPGGALWLVYPGQLPGTRAGSMDRLLCNERPRNARGWQKGTSQAGLTPPLSARLHLSHPKSSTETLHHCHLLTRTFTETSDTDKDAKQESVFWKLHSK